MELLLTCSLHQQQKSTTRSQINVTLTFKAKGKRHSAKCLQITVSHHILYPVAFNIGAGHSHNIGVSDHDTERHDHDLQC